MCFVDDYTKATVVSGAIMPHCAGDYSYSARTVARMVVASSVGFIIAVQFISAAYVDISYFVVLLGASAVKLAYSPAVSPELERKPGYSDLTSGFNTGSAVPSG